MSVHQRPYNIIGVSINEVNKFVKAMFGRLVETVYNAITGYINKSTYHES